jgi:hypothetical protein
MSRAIKRRTPQTAFAILASIVGFGLFGGSITRASLIPLTVGGTDNFATGNSTALPGGTPLQSLTSNILDASSNVLGTVSSQVFPDGLGGLEFVYQVNITANDDFDSVTLSRFSSSVTTNVGYNNPGGDVDPTNVQRTINRTLDWGFQSAPAGNGSIGPGNTGDYLIVDAPNATNVASGTGSIIDNTTGQGAIDVPFLMPINVPEPTSVGLIVLAGGILMGRRRRA